MEFYTVNGSPNCHKVEAVIHHLDLDVETRQLDFLKGDLRQPQYLALNPNGKVPCLVDGDFPLWESNAIMQYLADTKPGTTLFPQEHKARADVVRWQSWELAHWHTALGTVTWETWVKPNYGMGEPNHELVKAATENLHRYAAVLDAHLSTRQFICGDDVTLADFSVGSPMTLAQAAKLPLDAYANINAWYQRLEQVPAWAASLHEPPKPQ